MTIDLGKQKKKLNKREAALLMETGVKRRRALSNSFCSLATLVYLPECCSYDEKISRKSTYKLNDRLDISKFLELRNDFKTLLKLIIDRRFHFLFHRLAPIALCILDDAS